MPDYTERQVLTVHSLRLDIFIGFLPEERAAKQPVEITYSYELDKPQADDISHTVDYMAIANKIRAQVSGSNFNLLESLIQHVMGIIWEFKQVRWAEVVIRKPDAPIPGAQGSSVRLERKRK